MAAMGPVTAAIPEDGAASIVLFVHSGTGNSLRVARWLEEDLRADGRRVGSAQVADGQPLPEPPVQADGLLVLVFPTHGFTAPWSVLRHACSLPRRSGVAGLVLATRGGTRWGPWLAPGVEGTAGLLVATILALKGYRVRGWRGIDMPSNWTALHSALGARSVEALRGRARMQVTAVAGCLRDGRPVMGPGTVAQTLLGLLLAPVSLGYLLMGRQLLGKLFLASGSCDGCGVCRDRCPNRAISWFRRRPYWTLACESCMRCMSVCPRQAVQATQALAGAWLLLTSLATGAVAAAAGAWLATGPAALALSAVLLVPILIVGYGLAWLLGRTPILGLLAHGLTLTRWYRRHRDPEVTVSDLRPAAPRDRKS